MSQVVTEIERCVTYITVTVTQTYDTEKNIKGYRISNIIYSIVIVCWSHC